MNSFERYEKMMSLTPYNDRSEMPIMPMMLTSYGPLGGKTQTEILDPDPTNWMEATLKTWEIYGKPDVAMPMCPRDTTFVMSLPVRLPGRELGENELYQCIDIMLNKTAMAKMKVKIKVKQPRTGVVKELSLIGSDQVGEARIDKRQMNYLYNDGTSFVFMDNETYEQVEIPQERLEWESKFLVDNQVNFLQHIMSIVKTGGRVGVVLPDKVELELVECEQAVKGNTATSASKNAVCETGLEIKVPLFIENGERVIVSTNDGKYCGRA